MERQVLPRFGSMPLWRITNGEVRLWMRDLLSQGLSAATVRKAVFALRQGGGRSPRSAKAIRPRARQARSPRGPGTPSRSPDNTDEASDILVASLLDVVETNSAAGPRAVLLQAPCLKSESRSTSRTRTHGRNTSA